MFHAWLSLFTNACFLSNLRCPPLANKAIDQTASGNSSLAASEDVELLEEEVAKTIASRSSLSFDERRKLKKFRQYSEKETSSVDSSEKVVMATNRDTDRRRVLVLCSRGTTSRYRHLMLDLRLVDLSFDCIALRCVTLRRVSSGSGGARPKGWWFIH